VGSLAARIALAIGMGRSIFTKLAHTYPARWNAQFWGAGVVDREHFKNFRSVHARRVAPINN
jgi:hypothetical protein